MIKKEYILVYLQYRYTSDSLKKMIHIMLKFNTFKYVGLIIIKAHDIIDYK